MIKNLSEYKSPEAHKIIAIDTIKICNAKNICQEYNNVIIDITTKGTRIFFKDPTIQYPISIIDRYYDTLEEDYNPLYQKMFAYYEKHKKLDEEIEKEINEIEKSSVHQLLTPESIAKIREAEEKKQAEQKKEKPAASKS